MVSVVDNGFNLLYRGVIQLDRMQLLLGVKPLAYSSMGCKVTNRLLNRIPTTHVVLL